MVAAKSSGASDRDAHERLAGDLRPLFLQRL
jgi:hypothetical protein